VDIDLDRLVAQFKPVVGFKVKKALGWGNPDWEDVTNEILTQAIEKVRSGEFRGDSTLGTFIYTIASRRIVDYVRRKTRPLRGAPESGALPDPREELEREQGAEQLAAAVRSLKPRFREVLRLYYYEDKSREEVARALGITPAQVSERVNYAQKLLRKRLRP